MSKACARVVKAEFIGSSRGALATVLLVSLGHQPVRSRVAVASLRMVAEVSHLMKFVNTESACAVANWFRISVLMLLSFA